MAFDGLDRIGQVALHVGDVADATAFYRDTLGMRLLFEAPGMAFFDCAGTRLMLGEPESEADLPSATREPGTILYFDVPDIQAAHGALAERGVAFVESPRKVAELDDSALWLAFFRDPWGNVLALMSEVARAG
jgi:catechol 2,3-dioxygenase-like lactoylglutathione lyase family enzyme